MSTRVAASVRKGSNPRTSDGPFLISPKRHVPFPYIVCDRVVSLIQSPSHPSILLLSIHPSLTQYTALNTNTLRHTTYALIFQYIFLSYCVHFHHNQKLITLQKIVTSLRFLKAAPETISSNVITFL